MHLEHSVQDRPMEKIEKNDTGGVRRKMNISDWTGVLRGNLKSYWGEMGVVVSPVPAERCQIEDGRRFWFLSLLFFFFFFEGQFVRG